MHTLAIEHLKNLKLPKHIIKTFIDKIQQIFIKYFTYIILNKHKLRWANILYNPHLCDKTLIMIYPKCEQNPPPYEQALHRLGYHPSYAWVFLGDGWYFIYASTKKHPPILFIHLYEEIIMALRDFSN